VPLIFNRGKTITYISPQLEYEHSATHYFADGHFWKGLDYLQFRLYMTRYLKLSYRDLYPRLGEYIQTTYTATPGDLGQLGSLLSIAAGLYLPGITYHHHLLLKAAYQKQYLVSALFYLPVNRIDFPRGYPSAVSAEFQTLSADYAFPVAYPDFSVGPVIYLKRLRMDLFYDMSYGKDILENTGIRYTGSYSSTGTEIMADFHLARIIFPVSAGVRIGYLLSKDALFSEFLLSIHTNAF
jgi:hypothetical protein